MIEPEAGAWQTWILASGDQLRPATPPNDAATAAELTELREMVADRDADAIDRIAYWDAGSPGYRWNEIALHQAVATGTRLEGYRLMALFNAAIYDTTIAAWDATIACWESKFFYWVARPIQFDSTITTILPTYGHPDYPSGHSAQ